MSGHPDQAVHALAQDGRVRILACVTTNLVNELQTRHQTWPIATAALGRTASIAAMMGLMLKNQERIMIQIKGDGPLGEVVVDADSEGHVRGYVGDPQVHLPSNAAGKLNVGGGIGQGMLYVMRDTGLKDVYRGSVELQTGEIADDFTYYFALSEQTPSSVGAGVLVDTDNSVLTAGGFIIQMLPGHTGDDIRVLENRLADIPSVTDLLAGERTAAELVHLLMPEARVLETRELEFQCTCSQERMLTVLKSLGAAELKTMIDDQHGAEIICHFCSQAYHFSETELTSLHDEIVAESQK